MNPDQVAAVYFITILARKIQENNPEIADMWLSGAVHEDIAKYLEQQGYKESYLVKASQKAISGHNGGLGIEAFVGLVDDKTRDLIGRSHMAKSYITSKKRKKGLYGLSPERRREIMVNAGKAAVKVQRKRGIALFGLNSSELRAASMKGLEARGCVPWILEVNEETGFTEPDYARHKASLPEYHYVGGPYNGFVMWKRIATELNDKYHKGKVVRTARAVKQEVDFNKRKYPSKISTTS